jgi:hypothetical protein
VGVGLDGEEDPPTAEVVLLLAWRAWMPAVPSELVVCAAENRSCFSASWQPKRT